ncbi:MAG: hypothetical protein Q4F66_10090 [Clostridium sp.]|nr:hypothetical protein [Clostridium sp.]
MERTYNAAVDNGLYVLAYYLKKSVEEITEKDIEESIEPMSKKVAQYFKTDKYHKLTSMLFMNSVLTQKTKETLGDKLNTFLKECAGDEMCYICGKYNCNSKNTLGRSYLLNSCAGTFYNFSNNLMGMNVCPYCTILTMYASLNFIKCGNVAVYYNSPSDEFMSNYTYERQHENKSDILSGAVFDKKNEKGETYILDELLDNNILYDETYVEQYKVSNGGTDQIIEVNTVDSDNIKILNAIRKSGYYNEFKKYNLLYNLIKGNLEYVYLYKLYDFEKMELKCSREFFEIMNKEVSKLTDDVIKVVKSMTDKINETEKMNTNKIVNNLKLINKFDDYENMLVELCTRYDELTSESLFSREDYLLLDNYRKFKSIKNLMLVSFIVK